MIEVESYNEVQSKKFYFGTPIQQCIFPHDSSCCKYSVFFLEVLEVEPRIIQELKKMFLKCVMLQNFQRKFVGEGIYQEINKNAMIFLKTFVCQLLTESIFCDSIFSAISGQYS